MTLTELIDRATAACIVADPHYYSRPYDDTRPIRLGRDHDGINESKKLWRASYYVSEDELAFDGEGDSPEEALHEVCKSALTSLGENKEELEKRIALMREALDAFKTNDWFGIPEVELGLAREKRS